MYDLASYAAMLSDPVRGQAYLAAVRETVREGSVFADIGAGPGVLGVYAATLGARHVYIVEPDHSVGAAEALARENGVLDRIEIIPTSSLQAAFPERADAIVTDLRGVMPLLGDHLEAAADMRARLLAPGGRCAPIRDTMHIALVEDADMHERVVGAWRVLGDTVRHGSLTTLVANRWVRTHASAGQMLTESSRWATLEYGETTPPLAGDFDQQILRTGTAHGMLCWFDTDLTESVGFSNSPHAPRALYGQAYFPFEHPIQVREGDRARVGLRAVASAGDYEWAWWSTITRGELAVGSARHASMLGRAVPAATIARRSERYTPSLSDDARALAVLLPAVNGVRDFTELARLVREALPERFGSDHDALRFVTAHEALWAR